MRASFQKHISPKFRLRFFSNHHNESQDGRWYASLHQFQPSLYHRPCTIKYAFVSSRHCPSRPVFAAPATLPASKITMICHPFTHLLPQHIRRLYLPSASVPHHPTQQPDQLSFLFLPKRLATRRHPRATYAQSEPSAAPGIRGKVKGL